MAQKMPSYLTEVYLIKRNDPRWQECDRMSFLAKNIFNVTNYIIRQSFFADKKRGVEWDYKKSSWTKLLNNKLFQRVRDQYPQDYHAVPNRVVKGVVKVVVGNWQGYRKAWQDWRKNPHKYLGEPKPPSYKLSSYKLSSENGRAICVWNDHKAVSKPMCNKHSTISMSGCDISVELGHHVYERIREIEELAPDTPIRIWERIAHVRLCPQGNHYKLEIVYHVNPVLNKHLDPDLIMGIDLGVNNLMAITSNKARFKPVLVNGRPVKSINQYFNKKRAQYQSKLAENQYRSYRLQRLYKIRSKRIKDYLHTASKRVIDMAIDAGIGVIAIGQNKNWKQRANMGKRNNQSFLSIPHTQLIEMITYKAQLAGIQVICQEESYTSKCSFLDIEPIKKHKIYAGKRVKRGMFVAGMGQCINADVNASYNIIRKAVPNAFANGIEGVAVHPVAVSL